MHHLRFRQVHLDFHTSPVIPCIGLGFDKDEWQATLRAGHVDSITLFAKCHHGWHYHLTQVGKLHPNLSFDLLRAQFDACKEININAPIYLSAGLDDAILEDHPEWQCQYVDGGTLSASVPSPLRPGFHHVCFNSPYTDYLVEQIKETLSLFPNCDGIFLDIISQPECCCVNCMRVMHENGLNPLVAADRQKCSRMALERYYQLTTQAVTADNPDMPVFHNSGHITPGRREQLKKYFSHLELESLPTGGWGYDHFPLSAKYVQTLDFDFLGMTGKFHTTWGEFGGFKHPNALRYECAAMMAFGAKCSIGDQLHPSGKLDESTYELIGAAYAEVEAKEPWCDNVSNVAEIGLLTAAAVNGSSARDIPGDIGAGRILLEGHFLFDVIDCDADFKKYRMLILPDDVNIPPALKKRLDSYLAKGGKLLLSGNSGVDADGAFMFDIGAKTDGISPYRPDYVLLNDLVRPASVRSPMVMYLPSRRLKVTEGTSLGDIYDPYFNRTDHGHFCSHQHTPNQPQESGYAAGVKHGNILYLAHPVFSIYRGWGNVPLAEYARNAVRLLLGESQLETNLPSTARVSLMEQPAEKRAVLHLLYANTVNRGGPLNVNGVTSRGAIEVIEELLPLHDVKVTIKPRKSVKKLTLEPQGTGVLFSVAEDGRISFKLDQFTCHQMVVMYY
ncbi:MAG: beta-galactosidase trimerization domain-containing protein [Lentisphaeria bacterium]|nr:beta-galactosidase trimerization domain-containing protein [Lentisphaeria bacterium]